MIRRNDYGNVDARRLPAGCVLMECSGRHATRVAQACRNLGVDYAKAVTGWRRKRYPVFGGTVIEASHEEAVLEEMASISARADKDSVTRFHSQRFLAVLRARREQRVLQEQGQRSRQEEQRALQEQRQRFRQEEQRFLKEQRRQKVDWQISGF